MTEMTREERELFEAQADHEAWSYAAEIMEPWMAMVGSIGSDELTRVMEKAFAEVEMQVGRTLDVLEGMQEGVEPFGSYRSVLERISHHHGFSGAEEVARRAAELDPSYTVEDLMASPQAGYGTALDAVLGMNDAERCGCPRRSPEASCHRTGWRGPTASRALEKRKMANNEPQMNAFGECLREIMLARGVDSIAELVELLRAAGYDTDEETVRGYMYGTAIEEN